MRYVDSLDRDQEECPSRGYLRAGEGGGDGERSGFEQLPLVGVNGAEIPDPGEVEKDAQRARLDARHRIGGGGIVDEEETRRRTSLDQGDRQQPAGWLIDFAQGCVQIE